MLAGKTNEERIWNYLTAAGMTACGAAGLMGNLYAESGLIPTNIQNSYEKKLGYTDATYRLAVDSGEYKDFATDGAGYGLAQWTYHTRKAALLAFAKERGASIGDLEMQLAFLLHELGGSFPGVLSTLKTAKTIEAASNAVLLKFERPDNQGDAVKLERVQYGQVYYDKYATGKKPEKGSGTVGFTNSPLATVKLISPNRTINRNHAIDTITIHCFVGQVTAKSGCNFFLTSGTSCNYVVGYDGSIGLCVEEKDRSWCSGGYTKDAAGNKIPIRVNGISGSSNDYQAVTIETACEAKHPYAITDKAMDALVELCADICRRNGIRQLLWQGDKSLVGNIAKQNMTVHRWFAPKACPGDYIYNRLGEIAAKVNTKLGTTAAAPVTPAAPVSAVPYIVRVSVNDLRIRTGPGTNYNPAGTIKPGVYTIVSEATGAGAKLWGKLKSGAGWIALDYAKKI